jgi:hypothetical protein
MSAPGVHLYSPVQMEYFEFNVRTYVQKIEQAVEANNFPVAQQAFGQLNKLVGESNASGEKAGHQKSAEISKSLARVGQALNAGDADGAASALAEFKLNLLSPSTASGETEAQSQSQTADEETQESPQSSQQLNVRI